MPGKLGDQESGSGSDSMEDSDLSSSLDQDRSGMPEIHLSVDEDNGTDKVGKNGSASILSALAKPRNRSLL